MKIEYWTSTPTHDYVMEYIDAQSAKDQKKIFRDLSLVEKYGTTFINMKQLTGYKMYEIRIKSHRFFCAVRGSVCWLLHAFTKKSRSTPLKDIRTALKRMRDLDDYLLLPNIA